MTPRRRGSRFRPRLAPNLVAADTRTELAGRTEQVLLGGIGRGEQMALLELYRRHGPLVYAAARRAGGPSRAETVTRAVFLRLWANPGAFRPGHESLRSFLFAQAHAEAADPLTGTSQGVIDARHEGECPCSPNSPSSRPTRWPWSFSAAARSGKPPPYSSNPSRSCAPGPCTHFEYLAPRSTPKHRRARRPHPTVRGPASRSSSIAHRAQGQRGTAPKVTSLIDRPAPCR